MRKGAVVMIAAIIAGAGAGHALAGIDDPRERAKLSREQNRANRNVYRKKHNVRRVNVQ